jgi:hypothetical protein
MGLLGVVTLNISGRDLTDVWDNLQSNLVAADGIEPLAIAIVFETYDLLIVLWCEQPENLNRYIINRLRSMKGVTETTVFFLDEMQALTHDGMESEPGIDGHLMLDVECGKEDYVVREVSKIGPEAEKTFTKFIAAALHSSTLDLLVGFKGTNLYYLDELFSKIRLIDGVIDIEVQIFARFKTLVEYDQMKDRFSWLL